MPNPLDIEKIPAELLDQWIDGHHFQVKHTFDGEVFGLLWCHPVDNIDQSASFECGISYPHCESTLIFDGGDDDHRLLNIIPLTIMPSLVCLTCHEHGFFVNGQWYGEEYILQAP